MPRKRRLDKPVELEVLKESVGVWDAEIEVWAAGLDASPLEFKGVETIRPFGEYWIASDFDSEFGGETTSVHSIVGYDLDKKELVGMVVDSGPYAAQMTGEYDPEAKSVRWVTKAKAADGTPMVQRTTVTHKSIDERVLVLSIPAEGEGEFLKFMQIRYVRRK